MKIWLSLVILHACPPFLKYTLSKLHSYILAVFNLLVMQYKFFHSFFKQVCFLKNMLMRC